MIIKKNYPFLSTTPSTDIILHPLYTIPYTQPLPSILSPPYHPHSTHPPCLYLSLSLLINYTLSPHSPPYQNQPIHPARLIQFIRLPYFSSYFPPVFPKLATAVGSRNSLRSTHVTSLPWMATRLLSSKTVVV